VELLLLVAALVVGLILIPFGLPGLWLMVGAALLYSYARPHELGLATLIGISVLAVGAEALEWVLSGRYTRKYGGSRRAGWGAILGGMVGAMVGVPVPVIGSVIGGFVGAFVGAALLEYTRERHTQTAARAGWGAVLGRAAAAGAKMALGIVIVVAALFALLHGPTLI
jgi:uncharacterized protein YqgC (DUF456 family)